MIAGQVALLLAGIFAGAALYVNVAEQPARMKLGDESALAQWKPSYARGFAMQSSIAAVSGGIGLVVAWQTQDWRWVIGAALILVNWPYTLLVIMPTNNRLEAVPEGKAGAASRALMVKWGRLHAVRTALG